MTCHIVTEGPSDSLIVRELIKPEYQDGRDINIMDASERSGAIALASALLASRREPVVLIVNTYTTNSDRIDEDNQYIRELVGLVARASQWKTLSAIPEIESLFFIDRKTLKSLVGTDTHISTEQFVRGKFEPRKVLEELLPGKYSPKFLEQALAHVDWSAIRKQPLVTELKAFLSQKLT